MLVLEKLTVRNCLCLSSRCMLGTELICFLTVTKKNNNKKSIGNIERLKLSRIILVISKTVF